MQINRTDLLQTLAAVRPALANRPFIKSLSHVLFHQGRVCAYNEVIAIEMKLPATADFPHSLLVPGELLIQALSQFSGAEITVKLVDGTMSLGASGAGMKLALLAVDDFLFDVDEWAQGESFPLTPHFITGLNACLGGVSKDDKQPAAMGVTMTVVGDGVVLFSTDNKTITRFETGLDAAHVPERVKQSVILPTAFCEQVVALSKLHRSVKAQVTMNSSFISVDFDGAAAVYARLQNEFKAIGYEAKVESVCPLATLAAGTISVPEGFDAALARAALVVASSAKSVMTVTVDAGCMVFDSDSGEATAHDVLSLTDWIDDQVITFKIDPALLQRAAKTCDAFLPLPGVFVMLGHKGDMIHLIAHSADA